MYRVGCNLFDAPVHQMMTSLQLSVTRDPVAVQLGISEVLHLRQAAAPVVRPCDPRPLSRHLVPEKVTEVRSVFSDRLWQRTGKGYVSTINVCNLTSMFQNNRRNSKKCLY